MASAGDSSDSDRNIGPAKNHGSSVKRLVSSSEEETTREQNKTPSSARNESENCVGSRRHSLRKRQKNFRLPSREEQWSSIRTDSRVSNKLSHLKPRKLINDFTRVTHRYNHDYQEVSGEESMEEFLKGTDSSESESDNSGTTRERGRRKQKGHRVKGYRPHIVIQSDESSEDEHPVSPKPHTDAETHLKNQPETTAAGQQEDNQQSNEHQLPKKQERSDKDGGCCSKESNPECVQDKNSESSDEDTEPVISRKSSKRKSVLESDNEKSSQNSSSDEQDIVIPSRKRARAQSAVLSDSESEENDPVHQNLSKGKQDSVLSNQDNKLKEVPAKSSTCDTKTPGKDLEAGTAVTINGASPDSAITVDDSESSRSDDSSGSDENSQDSSDGVECSRIEKLAAMKKQKRNSMLDRLKAARAKRLSKT